LGLSEEADALILVVSEETGKISIAQDGLLTVDLDEAALRNRIYDAFKLSTPTETTESPS
jgi:diadenylate cyclase